MKFKHSTWWVAC